MLQHRLLAALLLAALIAVPLVGQEKDKGKATEKPAEKASEKAAEKPAEKTPPPAGDKVSLRWKLEKGKTFYQKMTTKTDQNMKILSSEPKQTQNQTFWFSYTPDKQDGDTWTIKQKIEGVAMDIDIGGSKINYSSVSDANAANPLAEFFKALVGSEFTLTLNTKEQKVTKVDGVKDFVEKLTKANPQMKQLLEQILSEPALKEMAEPTFAAIPNKDVVKGDKWTRTSTLDMGPIGKYTNTYSYSYDGKDGKLEKIKVDTELKYTAPDDKANAAGLPFKIKTADLKGSNASGTVLFDPEKGRVEKSTFKLELSGTLEVSIGDQVTKVELKQTQETSVETTDTNPLAKKS